MLHVIQNVVPMARSTLALTYAGGESVLVDLGPLIRKGGVFSTLADPEFFARVRVGQGGRYLEWPGDIDLCADALWRETHSRGGREAA